MQAAATSIERPHLELVLSTLDRAVNWTRLQLVYEHAFRYRWSLPDANLITVRYLDRVAAICDYRLIGGTFVDAERRKVAIVVPLPSVPGMAAVRKTVPQPLA